MLSKPVTHRRELSRWPKTRPGVNKKVAAKPQRRQKISAPKKFDSTKSKHHKKFTRASKAQKLQALLRRIKVFAPNIPLNLNFYRSAEGVYGSYWLGKFINTLQLGGGKKTVEKQVYSALQSIKYATAVNPLLLYLETLDKIKPIFRLRNYIVRRVIIKEYPIVVLRPRRLILAVHWLKEEVRNVRARFADTLTSRVTSELLDFRAGAKKHILVKKRNEYLRRTVKAQFNLRYTYK